MKKIYGKVPEGDCKVSGRLDRALDDAVSSDASLVFSVPCTGVGGDLQD